MALWLMNPTNIHEEVGLIPGLAQCGIGAGIAVSCSVSHRDDSDPALLWVWRRLAAAALIDSLAWELPFAVGAVLKRK